MKTEHEIAKENIKDFTTLATEEHKGSCERFLDFLEEAKEKIVYVENEITHYLMQEKITDLKQAIKEYDNHGI